MKKIYALLRNNQQSGPYTLDELVSLNLKPFDLIWMEGKSAGWCYPSEVDDLKTYVQEQPALKKEETPVLSEGNALPQKIEQQHNAAVTMKTAASQHIYVSLPAGQAKEVLRDEEVNEISFEQRVEKMRQRVAAVANGENTPKDDIDTKYSRSLEDIKEEYSEWMQKNKKKTFFPVKKLMAAALLLLVVSAGFYTARLVLAENTPANKIISKQQTSATYNELNSELPKVNIEKKASLFSPPLPAETKNETVAEPKKNNTLIKQKNEPPVIAASSEEQPEAPVDEEEIKPEPAIRNAPEAEPIASLDKQITVNSRYIPAKDHPGIEGAAITVNNNSSEFLKVVAVDVFYHQGDNIAVHKETLYFSNLAPQNSYTLKVPANSRGDKIYCQLGLISSEKGAIYFAKQ